MKCLYHKSDMDGWCSAAIVSKYTLNKDPKDFIGIDYDKNKIDNFPEILNATGQDIYISDVSFNEETVEILRILVKNNNVIWNDHHDTSIELEKKYEDIRQIKGYRSKEASGALLTWRYLYTKDPLNIKTLSHIIPKAVLLVSDWDCWHFKFGDMTYYFKYYIDTDIWYTYPTSDQWRALLITDGESSAFQNYLNTGKVIYEYILKEYDHYRRAHAYESQIDNIRCAVVNRSCNSLIFGDLYKKYPFVATFVFNGQKFKYSLYSSTDVDCSKIAEKFGGGGHKGAAGFTSDKLVLPYVSNIDWSDNDEQD